MSYNIKYILLVCAGKKIIELEKVNRKVPGNDKWGILDVIPLMILVGVNHSQPILHMSK